MLLVFGCVYNVSNKVYDPDLKNTQALSQSVRQDTDIDVCINTNRDSGTNTNTDTYTDTDADRGTDMYRHADANSQPQMHTPCNKIFLFYTALKRV